MSDRYDQLVEGFQKGLIDMKDLLEGLPDDVDPHDVGYEAARAALAPVAWARAVGDRMQTAEATDLLGVTRQALQKRVQKHTLIGLPGKQTTHFPVWQFDRSRRQVRPAAERVLQIFRASGEFDPYMIAAWMVAPCEELGQAAPAGLLEDEGRVEEVFKLARAVAKRWAQ
ncbi:hypothetical protein [Streptacidiphilus neutrinimicus]|uniref:hypothetical protein n=1 Tax=Streptacidiphilus neutrinimicus TaxID=105420 RepID=UPI00069483A6|nr:hypothetical protein [Streptacidiphilus neutrinimicus]